jgi:5-formyltetrahydrofolate cyclo-ligase
LYSGGADAKRQLRAVLAERRRRVPPNEALTAGRAVAEAVMREPRVRRATFVALYSASDGELPTRALFEALGSVPTLRRLLPRFRDRALDWGRVDDWDDLVPGRFGILEPALSTSERLSPRDVVLAPGIAFDIHGWRLGRGGGYYDQAFPPGTDAPWLVGIGYTFQWISEVPHYSRDRRVNAIVTEDGWVRTGAG